MTGISISTSRSDLDQPKRGPAAKSKHKVTTRHDDSKQEGIGWNSMSHLRLKRFADNDTTLTPGARRNRAKYPNLVVAELDPSGRAACKMCGERICKGSLRLCLWLECHKGYRNKCTLHPACFWRHPETQKLESFHEISLDKHLRSLLRQQG